MVVASGGVLVMSGQPPPYHTGRKKRLQDTELLRLVIKNTLGFHGLKLLVFHLLWHQLNPIPKD